MGIEITTAVSTDMLIVLTGMAAAFAMLGLSVRGSASGIVLAGSGVVACLVGAVISSVNPAPDVEATVVDLEDHYGIELSRVDGLEDGDEVRVRLADGSLMTGELLVDDGEVAVMVVSAYGRLAELEPAVA